MNLKLFIALFAAAALATGTLACDEKKADDKKEEAKKDDDKKKDEAKEEKEDEGDTKEAKDEGGDGDLPQECQDYVKYFDDCSEKIPAESKAAYEMAMKTFKENADKAATPEAKAMLKTTCEQSLKAMKDAKFCE